jgi:phosphomannomutase
LEVLTGHRFHPSILREYDIRGVVGETLSAADATSVGQAFGTEIVRAGGASAAVGFDGRVSSPGLVDALVQGLISTGIKVFRLPMGPTPMLYFAVYHLNAGGGIMVTGSHNPPSHNGFKLMLGKKSYFGEAIQGLGKLAAAGDFAAGAGEVQSYDIRETYLARVAGDYLPKRGPAGGQLEKGFPGRPLTVAWDPGNGATGELVEKLVARLPGKHVLLNEKIDGTFPSHHPDPTVAENLVQLQEAVRDHKCDLGFAFDGDGDRLGVIDGQGRILWGDQLLALLAREVLAEHPGATIIADVKASQSLFDEIARLGGKPLMWKTGHSLIKSKMAEIKSPLAGEMSGHIFMADRYFGFDDAIYVAVRFLSLASRSQSSVAQLYDSLPHAVNTPEMRFACADDDKFKAVDRVKAHLESTGARFNPIDGVRVETADGWWLLRASNTQAVLVARAEAQDQAGLDRVLAAMRRALAAGGIAAPPTA